MPLRSRPRLLSVLPVVVLALGAAGCGDDDPPDGPGALLAEDASAVWSVPYDDEWSPTDAVAVGDVVVVSSGWSIDEGTRVTAYDAEGSILWQSESFYGGAALGVAGDDQVVVCDDDSADVLSVDDGTVVEEAEAGDERCTQEDADADRLDHHDAAYSVSGTQLTVDGPDGDYTLTLEDSDPEVWGVEGGLVTYAPSAEDGPVLRYYR